MSEPPAPEPSAAPLAGRLLVGRYRLNRSIASGGMAEVWEATDETLARRVAVKLLHAHLGRDESFVRRFRAEAVAAARLAHPSIVSALPNIYNEEQLVEFAKAPDTAPLTADDLARIDELFRDNFGVEQEEAKYKGTMEQPAEAAAAV